MEPVETKNTCPKNPYWPSMARVRALKTLFVASGPILKVEESFPGTSGCGVDLPGLLLLC